MRGFICQNSVSKLTQVEKYAENSTFVKLWRELQFLEQLSSGCAPVYTSVLENYFTVHRKNCKMKNIFLNDINFVFF